MLITKIATNISTSKKNTCGYFSMQVAKINNNNYLTFNNKINSNFNNHVQITKRYLHQVVKMLPINLIALDKSLWINSEFYNSYKHDFESWDEINLSTTNTKCITIKKVISLYQDYLKTAEQKLCYNITYNQQGSVAENQDNEYLTALLADNISTIAFGELGNGNTFMINYYTDADYNIGSIVTATTWDDLIDYMNQQEVNLFIQGMHQDSHKQITALQQQNNEYNNINNLKLLLKQNLA
jgi:hypothetical protein